MGRVLTRRCSREGCERPRAEVGMLCAEHRATDPPRSYSRWRGGPTRHCPRCDLYLPIDRFPQDASGAPKSTCRSCRAAANLAYKARHRDELLARRRAAYPATRTAGWLEARRRWSLTP